MFSTNHFKKCCLVFSPMRISRQIMQTPFQFTLPAVSLSSTVCSRKTVNRSFIRNKLYPSHHLQHRLQHFDADKTTISFVDNIAIRHLTAGLFKTFSNIIKFNYMQIFYDRDFKLNDFVEGAKVGISFVSSCLGENDTVSVQEAVTADTLSAAEESVKELDEDKQSLLIFNIEDIFYFNILDIGIIEDGVKRYAEITTVAIAKDKSQRVYPASLKDFEKIRPENINPFQIMQFIAAQDFVLVCTCRFIKEFTKGVTDNWTVNKIHHTFVIPKKQ